MDLKVLVCANLGSKDFDFSLTTAIQAAQIFWNYFSVGVLLISNSNTSKMKIHAHLVFDKSHSYSIRSQFKRLIYMQIYPNVKLSIATTL